MTPAMMRAYVRPPTPPAPTWVLQFTMRKRVPGTGERYRWRQEYGSLAVARAWRRKLRRRTAFRRVVIEVKEGRRR